MKVTIYSVAVPILVALGFAQDKPPVQPPPASTLPASSQPQEKSTTAGTQSADKTTAQSDRLQEVKTQTYSGTLVEASCAGTGSDSKATASTASTNPAASSAGSAAGGTQGCGLSASASQFALQMKDGQTARFDDVGNTRAQEAMKSHKKWNDSAAANKPVRVKVSGVLNGDKLTVVSID